MTENDQYSAKARAVREWTARHSGNWTTYDEQRLMEWLAEDPEHRRAFESVMKLWEAAGDLSMPAITRITPQPRRFFSRRSVHLIGVTLAAAVLLIPVGSQLKQWWSGTPQHITTRIGELKTLRLSDNSTITLDADSDLIYQVGYAARRATLTRGEAFFSVTHDVRRPFIVTVGPGQIIDLGTVFDVESRRGAARVSVLEGRVALTSRTGRTELAAGQGAGFDREGMFLPVSTVDRSVVDWREGRRSFRDTPLSLVLESLERYLPVRFALTDPSLENLRVSGVFNTTDLHAFLAMLEQGFPVRARWMGSDRIELFPAS